MEKDLKKILDQEENVLLCILYGSAAAGTLTQQSDIDLAIAGEKPFAVEYLTGLQLSLSDFFRREVDLVDLSNAEGIFLNQILTKGRVIIKKNDQLYVKYIKKNIYFNEDMLPQIRLILKKRVERFANG